MTLGRGARVMLSVAVAACASAGRGSRPGAISASILPASEVMQSGAQDALRAIELTRPSWLSLSTRMRGASGEPVRVYVESTPYPDPAQLQRISASAVREIEFFDEAEATTRFGAGHSSGAIVVRLKR